MSREAPAARSDFKVWRKFTTRWADNDAYGHVNNTVFYQWFDSAVNAWLVEQGLLDIEAAIRSRSVVETRCTYFAPLAFPQRRRGRVWRSHELGRSSVRYRIGVFARRRAAAAAQGEFVHVLVDRDIPAAGRLPANWRRRLEAIS